MTPSARVAAVLLTLLVLPASTGAAGAAPAVAAISDEGAPAARNVRAAEPIPVAAMPLEPAPEPAKPSAVALAALAAERPPTLWIPPFGSLDVTGPYRPPPHRYGSGHRGIDLAAAGGTTVVAPTSGTVTFAGTVVDRPVVSVRASEGVVYSLEPVRSRLAAGDAVAAGDLLGEVAGGGHCLEECVHLGVRVSGEYVNPLRYFRSRPQLLPW